jgi:hypothetical protein
MLLTTPESGTVVMTLDDRSTVRVHYGSGEQATLTVDINGSMAQTQDGDTWEIDLRFADTDIVAAARACLTGLIDPDVTQILTVTVNAQVEDLSASALDAFLIAGRHTRDEYLAFPPPAEPEAMMNKPDIYPRNLEDGLKDHAQEAIQMLYGAVLGACGISSGDITPGAALRLEDAEAEMMGALTAWVLEGLDADQIVAAQNRMDGKTSAPDAIKAALTSQPDDTTSA